MRRAATVLLIALVGLLAAAGAESKIAYRALAPGSTFFVGTPLACEVVKAKDEIALSCLDRNPGSGDVYRESIGGGMIAGPQARVSLVDYAKDGSNVVFWHRSQPHHPGTGLFPAGTVMKGLSARPGDRFAVGDTGILCVVVPGPKLLCVVMKTKTFYGVPGTYGLVVSDTAIAIVRVNHKDGFDPIKAYSEPKFKS